MGRNELSGGGEPVDAWFAIEMIIGYRPETLRPRQDPGDRIVLDVFRGLEPLRICRLVGLGRLERTLLTGLPIEVQEFELIPDHLYLELLFMSYLIETNKYDLQKKFLEEHLMNWVPYYCDELASQAKTVFYREVAEITRDFLVSESQEEIE